MMNEALIHGNSRTTGPRRPTRGGFTLVEMVVSIVVGAIICGMAAVLILNASKQRTEASARSELTDAGASCMECILRYVREITQDECPAASTPCLNGNAQVATADTSQLRFGNYGFRLNSSQIQITSDNGTNWYAIATGATGLTFTYYDETNTVLSPLPLNVTQREDMRRVGVQITLAVGTQTVKLRTSIYLRNFMNEVMNAP